MPARMDRWGGPRKGAGRKPGFGRDPSEVRSNRVTFTLTDRELTELQALAEKRELPVGTLAYEYVTKAMRRAK